MCGIAGIIGQHSMECLHSISDSIRHRGPDDSGTYTDSNISLIHSRLSIQDLSARAHQPMIGDHGEYVIIFNGEIYNHWELRATLKSKYTFQSTSDTETLLYAFIEYGKEIVNKLNGIFAFAVYHKISGTVFIARDQFGVKPLYYYSDQDHFLFGSEIKSFLKFPGLNKSISYSTLVDYITFLFSPTENTPFEKVKKLLPGHYIELNVNDPQKYVVKKYFQISFEHSNEGKSEKEIISELESTLLKAIERQMIGDVPFGHLLSGGLDSSLLLALTKHIYPNRRLPCFTISNNQSDNEGFKDDLNFARLLSRKLGTELYEIESKPLTNSLFDRIIYHLDEPIADPAAHHLLSISEEVKKHGIKVLISGTGADELFSGYRRHQATYLEPLFNSTPWFFLKSFQQIASVLPKHPIVRRFEKLLYSANSSCNTRLASYFSWIDPTLAKDLFSEEIKNGLGNYNPLTSFETLCNDLPTDTSTLNKSLYLDINTYLAHNNLTYSDKMSMASGIEVRVPYLDIDLFGFSSRLPTSLKMKGITTKYLLRKLGEKYLPHEIIKRKKTGFGSPVRSWVKNDDNKLIENFVNKPSSIFNNEKVKELIEKNRSGKIDASYPILAIVAVESWMRQFVDSK